MDLTKIHTRSVIYFFKRLLQDTAGSLLVKQWKLIEKKDIVSFEDSMLPDVLRI